jgi:hypothetical protein
MHEVYSAVENHPSQLFSVMQRQNTCSLPASLSWLQKLVYWQNRSLPFHATHNEHNNRESSETNAHAH